MKKFFLFSILASLLIFMPVNITRAQLGSAMGNLDNALGNDTGLQKDLATNISTVVKGILSLVGTIFLLLTIYAGILWMTAQGEEAKVTKATQIIKASITGLIITLSAYAITYFVTTKLGGGSSNPNAAVDPNTVGCCMSKEVPNPKVCAAGIKLSECRADTAYWNKGACPANCPK